MPMMHLPRRPAMVLLSGLILSVTKPSCTVLSVDHKINQTEVSANSGRWERLATDAELLEKRMNREIIVTSALHAASGIYTNSSIISEELLQRLQYAVLVNVIEIPPNTGNQSHPGKYRHFFMNQLCYFRRYSFKSVVYLLDNSCGVGHSEECNSRFRRESLTLKEVLGSGDDLQIIPYPKALFWRTLSQKRTPIFRRFGRGDYLGDQPSFTHFGALVKIIPILEMIQYGFDAISFDVDVALLRDPMPQLATAWGSCVLPKALKQDRRNDSRTGCVDEVDVVVSMEMRGCQYPSLNPQYHDWRRQEPNSGVLLVKATSAGLRWLYGWLERIVNDNSMADQRLMNLFQGQPKSSDLSDLIQDGQLTTVCNDRNLLHRLSTNYSARTSSSASGYLKHHALAFCFLNEFNFMNGMMEDYCLRGKRDTNVEAFTLALHRFVSYEERTDNMLYPTSVHFNFVKSKRGAMEERRMWLLQHHQDRFLNGYSCKPLILEQSSYGSIDWAQRVDAAATAMALLINTTLNDGDATIFPGYASVYLFSKKNISDTICNLSAIDCIRTSTQLREVPNIDTFLRMGFEFSKVKKLSNPLYRLIPIGAQLPSKDS